MNFILAIWLFLSLVFLGVPSLYALYLLGARSRPWKLRVDETYAPPVTILIPTHNEEKTIKLKLENLARIKYPREKTQIILVDDASTDQTVKEASEFLNAHQELKVGLLKEDRQRGKPNALNYALQYAKSDIVIVSDADSFWAPDILDNALPYFSDPSVGAVVGRENVLDSKQRLITEAEKSHFDLMYDVIGLGESKVRSTIFFHGAFCAYRRSFMSNFNVENDDSGTALDVVQKGARAILIPEAICFAVDPITWKSKMVVKIRRASQLMGLWARCLKLFLKRQLFLPKKIALPEIFLYLFNPIIFISLLITTPFLILEYLPFSVVLLLTLSLVLLIRRSRMLLVITVMNYFVLTCALFAFVSRRKFVIWNPFEEPLTRDMLKRKNLI